MHILYIGAGFVGACSAAAAAASGHNVLLYDIDERKVELLSSDNRDTIESCLFEEGLGDLIVRNRERIEFTTDYSKVKKFLEIAGAVFLCVPTPEIDETGETDLRFYRKAAEELGKALVERGGGAQEKYVTIVNKSTVPINMVDETVHIMDALGVKNYGVVSNPEFLVEGRAVQGSLKPDRIVVGAWKKEDFEVMRNVYQRFVDSPTTQYIEINPKEAAASKLLANFYLFNRLAVCFDVIGRTCEAFTDLQFENIRRVLTTDERIGEWGFYDSLYSGGSCFIKDARSLSHQLRAAGQVTTMVDETHLANRRQLQKFLERPEQEMQFDWSGKTVALLGLSFKRDTNDIRNSPSIDIVHFLKNKGVKKIRAYDLAAMDSFAQAFRGETALAYAASQEIAIESADVIIIATDWPQFRGLASKLLAGTARPIILDGRRMLQHQYAELRKAGFAIIAVGSPLIK